MRGKINLRINGVNKKDCTTSSEMRLTLSHDDDS